MSNTLGKVVADFSATLNLKTAIWATSATLDSATDDDGVALPTGTYFLTLDRKSASKEYIKCTLTGTALTDIYHVSRQGALTSGTTKTHRKGATVEITDFAIIKKMLDLLDGTTDLNASVPLKYDGTATISNSNHLATKAYADGLAIAGSPDSSTTVKGIGKVSVAPVSPTEPIFVGDNDNRVSPVSLASVTADMVAALAGTGTPNGTTGEYVTNDDTATAATANKVARRLAGGNITVVTESQANNSTNAASTAYVDTGLAALVVSSTNWTTTKNIADASTTQNIAHGLGEIPKFIRMNFLQTQTNNAFLPSCLTLSYNGTTVAVSGYGYNGTWHDDLTSSSVVKLLGGSSSAYQSWVVTMDATNIIITWTKNNSPTGTVNITWEAFKQ